MPDSPLPKTLDTLQQGVDAGLHLGAQLCVSRFGETVADVAVGQSRVGVPMTTDTAALWLSMGKPLTAILVGKCVDLGKLDIDAPVAGYLPQFAQGGKDKVTIAHVLTHTGGFRNVGSNWSTEAWPQLIDRIAAAPLEDGWIPGQIAGYHVSSGWFILADLCAKALDIDVPPEGPWAMYREHLLKPLGMDGTWVGMPRRQWVDLGTDLALTYDTSKGAPKPLAFANSEQGSTLCRPGGNARGPAGDLATFYNQLLCDRGDFPPHLACAGQRYLSEGTARAFTSRQRSGLPDKTFGDSPIDWSYGFLMRSEGTDTKSLRIPYGYGPHASADTFGHSGNQCSCAFADPQAGLVVVWATNGQPGELGHQRRQRAINTAIYEDLGLA